VARKDRTVPELERFVAKRMGANTKARLQPRADTRSRLKC
jgi:hypothetical protein